CSVTRAPSSVASSGRCLFNCLDIAKVFVPTRRALVLNERVTPEYGNPHALRDRLRGGQVVGASTSRDGTLSQWIDVSISVGGHMLDDMGIFRTTVAISAVSAPDDRRVLSDVMVDTGSEHNWIAAATVRELGMRPLRDDRVES